MTILSLLAITARAATAETGKPMTNGLQVTEKTIERTRVSVVHIPTLRLPVVIYRGVLPGAEKKLVRPGPLKRFLGKNGWSATWSASGIASPAERHYHSTTPESVAVIAGLGRLRLSSDEGAAVEVDVEAGDLIFLPPGAWHQGVSHSGARTMGAYPRGAAPWDWNTRTLPTTADKARMNAIETPADPVFGAPRWTLF